MGLCEEREPQIWPLGCGGFLVSAPSGQHGEMLSPGDPHRRPPSSQGHSRKHLRHLRATITILLNSCYCYTTLIAILISSLLVLSTSTTIASSSTISESTMTTTTTTTITINFTSGPPKSLKNENDKSLLGQQHLRVENNSLSDSIKFEALNSSASASSPDPESRSSDLAPDANNNKLSPNKQRRSLLEPASSIFDSILGNQAPADSEQQQDQQEASESNIQSNHAAQFADSRDLSRGGPRQLALATNSMTSSSDKVTLPGDILLGGLFPIHMKGTKVECGQINRDRGIQRLEAMLYALDRINADQTLLPDIKLGAILLDSCSSSTYALNQSLEFIRASINTVESSAFECKDKSSPRPKYGSKMIAGVIGGSYSEVSLQVANLLRLFRIPQVSYASTGTALSDKTLYDLFARTVPSDMFQARAIADIVHKLGWSYVSLVSSEGLYGDSGSKEFVKQATERRICIATHEKISPTIGEQAIDGIVESLLRKNATGVVLFTRAEDTRELLLSVKRANLLHNFAWVAADGWGTHQKLVEGVEEVAWGAITVELQAKAIPGFDHYMRDLTPWANARNPWFNEYWQEWFDCQLEVNLLQQQRLASGYSRRSITGNDASDNNNNNLLKWQKGPNMDQGQSSVDEDNYSMNDYKSDSSRRARRSTTNSAACASSGASKPMQGANKTSDLPKVNCGRSPIRGTSLSDNKLTGSEPRTNVLATNNRSKRSSNFDASGDDESKVKEFCSPNLRISESNGYRQEQKVQFVVDAVYAMAHALHKAWLHLCGGQPGEVCEALKELNGGEFYTKYLLNVSFKDLAGSEVKFDEHGDGLGRYNIYNFRKVKPQNAPMNRDIVVAAVASAPNDSIAKLDILGGGSPDAAPIDKLGTVVEASFQQDREIGPGQMVVEHIYTSSADYEYSTVGRWTENSHIIDLDRIQFFQGEQSVPESYCSKPCELGQAKIMRAGDHCCWICKTCQPYEFLPDEFNCQDCGIGRWPMPNKTSCFDLPQKILRWDSIYSLISLSISCFGILLTLFVTIIFIRYIDTPVVKASGRELSFILLGGVASCHMATFVLLAKPTTFICGGQRFLVNFGFALMYASLLVKTNRISRIFNCARKSAKRPSFISPKSQMLITGILVAIQIFLTIVWFVFEPPGVRADSPEGKRDEVVLKCRVKGKSFILSLVYNMILITTCTIYAVKTRKIPENFNESKFIGFTMYTTIVIWLAFVTMFFGTNNSYEIQMNTMCVCISLSAYVTLFCLFSPKISIILLHPDKNVRKLTMNSATYKRAFKPVSSVASIEGRNNLATGGSVAQQDQASGGPMSTTSNVLNLESQAARLQESSVASNVVNSNSAGSNCSQKTPTNLSQQMALVGICLNCGSHQLSSLPTDSQTNALSTNTTSATLTTTTTKATSASATSANVIAKTQVVAGHYHPSASSKAGRTGAGSGCAKMHANLSTGKIDDQRHHKHNWRNQSQRDGTSCLDKNNKNSIGIHLHSHNNNNAKKIDGSLTSGRMTKGAAEYQVGGQQQTRVPPAAAAKILHHKITSGQETVAAHYQLQRSDKIKRAPSDDQVVMKQDGAIRSQQQNRNNSLIGGNGLNQHLVSMSRLNEMTSFISGGQDESVSSLANDSFMNTSLENTPCQVGGDNHHHHLSLSAAQVSGAAGSTANEASFSHSHHHRHHHHSGDGTVPCGPQCMTDNGAGLHYSAKGSDSMLCNQSVQSMDYCSDCCPSLCQQCSCLVCSSNGGDDSDTGGPCMHAQNSIGDANIHKQISVDCATGEVVSAADSDEADDDGSADDDGDNYDAMCILQFVTQNREAETSSKQIRSTKNPNHSTSSVRRRRSVKNHKPVSNFSSSSSSSTPQMGPMNSETLSSSSLRALQEYNGTNNPIGCCDGSIDRTLPAKRGAKKSLTTLEMRIISKNGTDSCNSKIGSFPVRRSISYEKKKQVSYNYDNTNTGEADGDDEEDRELLAAAAAAPVTGGGSRFSSSYKKSKKPVSKPQQSGSSSVAYALQTAAASALGPTFSGQVVSAASSAAPPVTGETLKRQLTKDGSDSFEQASQQMTITSSAGSSSVGTIQASLDLVKRSDEARRRSVEASGKQRRKSGCFNYHDEYEYSYGLVESQSDSEQDFYYDDGAGQYPDDIMNNDDESCPGQVRVHAAAAALVRERKRISAGELKDNQPADSHGDDDDADDFDHDGKFTVGRKSSSLAIDHSRGKRDGSSTPSRPGQHYHSQASRPTSSSTNTKRESYQASSSTEDQHVKELRPDEHRINSVALITATLSAGGAIVDSSGSSATTAPSHQAEQQLVKPDQQRQTNKPISSKPPDSDQAQGSHTSARDHKATYLGTF